MFDTNLNNESSTVRRQLIVLNEAIELVKSDDLIFSTKKLSPAPVQKWFPFIESIHDTLRQLEISKGEIQFLRIESPSEFLSGSYDFTFCKKILDNQTYVLWYIYDYTEVYTYLSKYQQLKNEADIYRQKLDYLHMHAKSLKELFPEDNEE